MASGESSSVAHDEMLDAGELGCGELILLLKKRLHALAPGQVLWLVARDPAAFLDVPAWCRVTGHRLCRSNPPDFYIQRKDG